MITLKNEVLYGVADVTLALLAAVTGSESPADKPQSTTRTNAFRPQKLTFWKSLDKRAFL